MNSSLKSLKNWFGYTRRERRATFILLVIILIFTGARYIIPQQSIVTEEIPEVFNQPDGADVQHAAQLVHHQRRQRLALHILGDDQQRLAAGHDLVQQRQQLGQVADLLLVDAGCRQSSSTASSVVGLVRK